MSSWPSSRTVTSTNSLQAASSPTSAWNGIAITPNFEHSAAVRSASTRERL
jgi:hypothetical protein